MKVIVLGGGMVGSAIASDLCTDFEVTVADRSAAALAALADRGGIATVQANLAEPEAVKRAVATHDLVVGAVPGVIGYRTVQACVEAGKDVVDISFFPEDAFDLEALCDRAGVRCLVDFGVAPGCSNLIFGRSQASFKRIDRFACYVGGLPVVRMAPWQYKAPFSPGDVLDEYIRPARYISCGRPITKPALADPELIHFEGLGTVEAFLTDGLRSLLRAEGVPEMVEKTCRYPGYRDSVALLRDAGFFDATPLELDGGQRVSPRDVTARLLFDAWRLGPLEQDLTAMRVVVEGVDAEGVEVSRSWDLLDRYDLPSRTTSMARTTGYTCTAGVRLLARGLYEQPGLSPPERVGRQAGCYDFVMHELAQRGVVFKISDSPRG